MQKTKPVALIILDGWGYRKESHANAISLAHTPHWDKLMRNSVHTKLSGSGDDVGLPEGQMGNSEVGHLCLGAGRILYQDLKRINHAIEDHSFFSNETLNQAMQDAKSQGSKVHLIGLLSHGGVHSHINHFLATLEIAHKLKVNSVYVHAFLDGRDTPPKSALSNLTLISNWFEKNPIGGIASLCGRYYAMDRDKRFERTKRAFDCLTQGKSLFHATNAQEGLDLAYQRGETDEFVPPTLIREDGIIEDNDVVIFLNFRADRARQLSYALSNPNFTGFTRKKWPILKHFVTLTDYDPNLKAQVAFKPQSIQQGLGEVLQNHGLKQLRLAETEKYAHVTFFFNGGLETPFQGEDRILIPSPKVATYDLKPEMSAYEVTDALTKAIETQSHDVIICNYANADMVGHTGNIEAAIKAVEVLDDCLGKIVQALNKVEGAAFITADHGNVEKMEDLETHQPHTAHTNEPVPLVYYGQTKCTFRKAPGRLSDIAPTILYFMGLSIPHEMTGEVLLSC